MRNAILQSYSSQLCGFGNINEIQMSNGEVSQHTEIKPYMCDGNISMDSKVSYDLHQLGSAGFSATSQLFINHQPACVPRPHSKRLQCCSDDIYQTAMPTYNSIFEHSILHDQISVSQFEPNLRKRPIESNHLSTKSIADLVGNETETKECGKHKKKKSFFSENQLHHPHEQLSKIKGQKVPARRSQKLTDKITALQKLVSPYGKTDTASVLQEASVHIRLLQDQLQNLYRMLSTSYNSTNPLYLQNPGKTQPDLRSRGFCLVPVSVTRTLTKEEQFDCPAISTKLSIPQSM